MWSSNESFQYGMFYAILGLTTYLLVISHLRYARVHYLSRKYPFKTRDSLSSMTDRQAFEIQKLISQLEFPFMVLKSLQFALFRVSYNVTCHPNFQLSSLLIASRHMEYLQSHHCSRKPHSYQTQPLLSNVMPTLLF